VFADLHGTLKAKLFRPFKNSLYHEFNSIDSLNELIRHQDFAQVLKSSDDNLDTVMDLKEYETEITAE